MDDWIITTTGRTTIDNWLDIDFVTVAKIMTEITNEE